MAVNPLSETGYMQLPTFIEPRRAGKNFLLAKPDELQFGKPRPPSICGWPECSELAGWEATPLCKTHALDVWAIVDQSETPEFQQAKREERTAILRARQQEKEAAKVERNVVAIDRMRQPGTIYYLRIGSRIKIGFTSYLPDRMKAYPPNSELLATHPGTRETERHMHHKFLHLLADGREWFTEAEDLEAHIASVNAQFPLEQGHKFKQANPLAS